MSDNDQASGIALTSSKLSRRIRTSEVYFAFGSGRLVYDCVTCGSKCCRGFGYAAKHDELVQLIAQRPSLRLFVQEPTGQSSAGNVMNYAPGCFFLRSSGQCDIHAKDGQLAKPETCRLFPFNQFLLAGDVLIVMPHQNLCPLGVMPVGAVSPLSDHESLLRQLQFKGINTEIAIWAGPASLASDRIRLERQILELSERHCGASSYWSFVGAQLVATDQARRGMDEAKRFVARACALLGVDDGDLEPGVELSSVLIAATPAIRAQVLFGPAGKYGGERLSPERLPFFLASLCVVACLAKKAGMQNIGLATLFKMLTDHRPLLHVMANLDQVMVWRRDLPVQLTGTASYLERRVCVRLVRSLLWGVQKRAQVPLDILVLQNLKGNEANRMPLIRAIASAIFGRIAPLDQQTRGHWSLSGCQQWLLQQVDADAIAEAVARRVAAG